jgi:glycosyltransferase involved in cell wall biosynthesis
MRVVHVVASVAPGWGGPVAVAAGLTSALSRQGVRCSIFAPMDRGATDALVPEDDVEVRLFPIGPVAALWPAWSPALGRALEREIAATDVVHIHELWHFPHWAAVRIARRAGVPYLITPHGQLSPWALEQKRIRKRVYSCMLQQRAGLERAVSIHALTPMEAAQVRDYGVHAPVVVVPNGVDYSVAGRRAAPDRLFQRFPELVDRSIVLFLGRLHAQKGIDLLVEAFGAVHRAHPNATLLVAGPGDSSVVAQLRASAAGLPDKRAIVFSGPLHGPDKQEAFSAARVFVLPSRSEGQSIALLEAMAAGLPVVVTPVANYPDVEAAGAGLVVSLSVPALTAAISALLTDSVRARSLGDRGRDLVQRHFTWDHVAPQMKDVYCQIAAGRLRLA